ncbi:MAG TPA: CDP-alcohol phosphatidyltransferase family protein [Tepidisphaeraceae bacterium]|nr:CDP-alcohol phosphatidyltransferase family protein [Tepidisphaeraceae bacterium]
MTQPKTMPGNRTNGHGRHRRLSRRERRLRLRRRGRRAYIRSVYFLPSLCTLGNALCGFGSMYAAFLAILPDNPTTDPLAAMWIGHGFAAAAYLIFLAMIFDALDGRLARFARHTTDFGGQLDSLADVLSFGAAPAFLMLLVFRHDGPQNLPTVVHRAVWAIGALYVSCAALRLARFNVSNKHGEQHHFSFLGLPSPGAASAVAAVVLMHHELLNQATESSGNFSSLLSALAEGCVLILPPIVFCTGLLMVSSIRYPHLVNRYLRGKRSITRLVVVVCLALLLVVAHQYTLGVGAVAYAFWGAVSYAYFRLRRKIPPIADRDA